MRIQGQVLFIDSLDVPYILRLYGGSKLEPVGLPFDVAVGASFQVSFQINLILLFHLLGGTPSTTSKGNKL